MARPGIRTGVTELEFHVRWPLDHWATRRKLSTEITEICPIVSVRKIVIKAKNATKSFPASPRCCWGSLQRCPRTPSRLGSVQRRPQTPPPSPAVYTGCSSSLWRCLLTVVRLEECSVRGALDKLLACARVISRRNFNELVYEAIGGVGWSFKITRFL